jgi:hypothetical protein
MITEPMTSGISALTSPAFISASETPVSLHHDGPKSAGEKQNAPNAYLTMTATRIASQLMGKCSIISPLNCAETLRNAAKRSRGE